MKAFYNYLENQATTLEDKLKNIATMFVILMILVLTSRQFLTPFFLDGQVPYWLFGPPAMPTWQVFVRACVIAPLWEEVAYRWFPIKVAKAINKEALLVPVIIASSIFFGYIHGSVVNIFIQGVIGLGLAIVYVKNGYCLRSSILLHSMWNIFCFLITHKVFQ